MEKFAENFKKVLESGLPGETSQSLLAPINRPLTSNSLKNIQDYKTSAVSILLFKENNSIKCILTQRTQYKGVHSQQVSFPGGRVEPADESLEHTARRESCEEIDLPINVGKKIGQLSQLYIPVSNFLVHPFVFYLDKVPDLHPEEREVAEIFTFDISELLPISAIKTADLKLSFGTQKDIPHFVINNKIVWGATAMILAEFREVILRF